MLIDQINALQTPAKQMLLGLYNDLADAIWIPNSVLPPSFHGRAEYQLDGVASAGKIYGKSVKQIENLLREKPTPVSDDKSEKEKRISAYAAQMEESGSFTYSEHEDRAYRAQVTFCTLMIEQGILTADDFEE
jgi:hypothetical protein